MSGAVRAGLVVGVLVAGLAVGEVTHVAAQRAPVPTWAPVLSTTATCPGPQPAVPVAGTASGPQAQQVEHVQQVEHGTARGLEAVRCATATTSAWFVGGGTTVGQTSELVLVNPDPTPAVVAVRLWSATGPVDPRPGRALRVPARGEVSVPLDRLAPDRDLLALHVAASRGRVAAYVQHVRTHGATPVGVAQVPSVAAPDRDVVVAGLPAGPGRRALVLANPAAHDVAARLQLTTPDGQLAPVEIDVPAGTSVAHELADQLQGAPAAARITSSPGPVLAAVLVEDAAATERDFAWAGAGQPVAGRALLPPLPPPGEQALVVTALEQDSVVDVVQAGAPPGAAAAPGRRTRIAAATTVELDVTALGLSAGLEVRPVGGRVHAARVLRSGSGAGIAVLPVVSPPEAVLRPAVVADPLLGGRDPG